jgi:starch synthase
MAATPRRRAAASPPAAPPDKPSAQPPAPLQVLAVASEMYPLLKTGGLADVVGALPGALAPLGVAVRTLLPGYPAVMARLQDVQVLGDWPGWFRKSFRLTNTSLSNATATTAPRVKKVHLS